MSIAARAALAVVLFVGFYALALGVAGLLVWLPFFEVASTGRIHLKLALLCVVGAGIIVWSVLPRWDRFVAPGPRLEPSKHPELFAEIARVAKATEQAPPADVYLVHDVNAFVTERGGMLGVGRRRVMGLGLPLLQVLDVSELRAVVAHEFGHFHGGDTALGPWIYRTRSAMGRTIENLDGSGVVALQLLQFPFRAYASLFMRVTLAVSRAQEYAADRLAAVVEGPRPLMSSLRKVHGAALAYRPYLESEVAPVLGAGHRPPFAAGFVAFLGHEGMVSAVERAIDVEIAQGEASAWDTHPCLRDRLAALSALPDPAGVTSDARPAIALLGDLDGAEAELLAGLVGGAEPLRPVSWDEVGTEVMLPQLRATAAEVVGALGGQALGSLRFDEPSLERLGFAWLGDEADPEQVAAAGAHAVQAAILARLAAAGFVVRSRPGVPLFAEGPGGPITPITWVQRIRDGEAPQAAWADALREAGADPDWAV